MKTNLSQARLSCALALGIGSSLSLAAAAEPSAHPAPAKTSIPWSQIGAKAGTDYQGDGLAVSPTVKGARLRCAFQKLEGEATREGLWLTSTVTNASNGCFRVMAFAVGRVTPCAPFENLTADCGAHGVTRPAIQLANTGTVEVADKLARFVRPALTEEYTVSMDGVRQDFVVLERPLGAGELAVRLAVSGAKVEQMADGVRLMLDNSGRKIAYSRLRVTDATGKELTARMEVVDGRDAFHRVPIVPGGDQGRGGTHPYLVVVVNDADAVYPVRIDPTFSDANWSSMNPSIAGADSTVLAAVVDGSGNVYIGGAFTVVGDVIANYIAKWDGSSWSALGSGMGGGGVSALAVSGSNVYAGGDFTTAGGSDAFYIAKWDGSSWSAVGSGMGGGYPVTTVSALAVSGSNVFTGGIFTTAGGSAATNIPKWDGSSWSALGSGMSGPPDYPYYGGSVSALAVSGGTVYAGGFFTNAGGSAANGIAKWDGSSWSALGSGMGGGYPYVKALAVSGSALYAGGGFTTAGGIAANRIAKWDGSSWSALGSGVSGGFVVSALAVSGSDMYAGGGFTAVGGSAANNIAKWDGSSWTALALGSGMNNIVRGLAVSGSNLYAGGQFTTPGGSAANYIAKWDGSSWSALGSGMDGGVGALAVSGSNLYAGGTFTTAGGTAATNIAKWDGSSWSALGSGMSGPYGGGVSALAVSGNDLYAGGVHECGRQRGQ